MHKQPDFPDLQHVRPPHCQYPGLRLRQSRHGFRLLWRLLCLLPATLPAGGFDLRINDVSGLDEPWPLMGGLPFPEGALHDAAQIRIVDADGGEIPAQIDVAATWRDGSIRWAQAGFAASPQGTYRVEYGPEVTRSAPAHPLVITETADGGLTLDAGAAVYTFLPDRLLPETALLGETLVLSNAGDGAYLVDNRGRLARVAGPAAEIQTQILKQGPVRTVVRREGWYVTADGERVARARMWFYVTAGTPHLRMTHSLVLTEDTNALWVRDYGLEFRTSEAPTKVTFALGESDEVFSPRGTDGVLEPVSIPFAGEALYLYQDTYPHFLEHDYRAVIGRDPRDGTQPLAGQRGDGDREIFWADHWHGVNDVAGDWAHARYAQHGMTLVTPYLAQRFPKEIAVGADSLRLALWSARGGRELDLRTSTLITEYWQDWSEYYADGVDALNQLSNNAQGMARTHEIWLIPHAPGEGTDRIARRAAAASDPPLVLADPFRLSATDAFDWPLHPKDAENFPEAEAVAERYWEGFTSGYRGLPVGGGFIDWGKTRTMRGGRSSFFRLFSGTMDYYLGLHVWGAYARSGARGYYHYGAWINQFAADIGIAHWTAGPKFKGGRATHGGYARSHTPLYWGSGSELGATATLTSFLNAYYLTGNERMRDVAEMIGQSYLDRWDPEAVTALARQQDGVFNTIAGLTALYTLTWNAAYAEIAGQLADALIDLDSPNGLSDEIRFGSLYKVDRNLFWLALYYRATGDERARQAVLKALDYKYRFGLVGLSSGTQDWAGLLYAIAYQWTGDAKHLRVLNYLLPVGIRRHEILATSYLQNHFTTINMPALMQVLSEVDEPIAPFPAAQQYRLPEPSTFLFRKPEDAAPVTFQATLWLEDDAFDPTDVRVTPLRDGGQAEAPLTGVTVAYEQAFITRYDARQDPHVYAVRIRVPEGAPAGLYFLDVPRAMRIRVQESTAPEIGVYGPEGLTVQGDTMPNYFRVNADVDALQIFLNNPAEVRRPDGTVAVEASGNNVGDLRIPVDGQTGVWSVSSLHNAIVRLINVEPILARSPAWLPVGANLEPAPRFQPPTDTTAFVPGRVGQALHLPGTATLEFPRGPETARGYAHFPRDEGTIEFWFRPNWASAELVYAIGGNFTDFRFLRAGSHALLYRRGRRRGGSPQLASLQLWLRNLHQDPGGPGRDPGEFTTGNPTLGGHTSQYWFEAGEWVHIAMTWRLSAGTGQGGHETALFVNGVPVEQEGRRRLIGAPRELPSEAFPLAETNARIEIGPIDGTLAQLRISDTVRYAAAFDPTESLPEPDPFTRVQFRLDGDAVGETAEGARVALEMR